MRLRYRAGVRKRAALRQGPVRLQRDVVQERLLQGDRVRDGRRAGRVWQRGHVVQRVSVGRILRRRSLQRVRDHVPDWVLLRHDVSRHAWARDLRQGRCGVRRVRNDTGGRLHGRRLHMRRKGQVQWRSAVRRRSMRLRRHVVSERVL